MKPKTMKRLLALPEEQQEKVMEQVRARLKKRPTQRKEPAEAAKPGGTATAGERNKD